MPTVTPADIRKQIAKGSPDPIYVIVGDDRTEMQRLTDDLSALVEEELRVFNVERLYATDRSVSGASIVEAARLLPMMANRRVVVVLRAEKLLKPKRRGKPDESAVEEEAGLSAAESDVLEAYVQQPEPLTTLVFVASDVDRTRRLYKLLQKRASICECWGLRGGKDVRLDFRQVARRAEQLVKQAAANAGQDIDTPAARLIADRAGGDIDRLRGDVDRLLLYAAGKARITLDDAREIASAESSIDDWAVTSAIQRRDTAEALKQLALSLDSGAVPYMLLGQLAWFVREKLSYEDPRRVPAAVEALLQTDLDLKSSGGAPRVLLERLVVELCGSRPQRAETLLKRDQYRIRGG
jgi:DNA polymerase-3 subunit delta